MKVPQIIRTFIAIEISKELRKVFQSLYDEMIKIPANVKWVNPDSIHLTLKFLGNISKSQVSDVNSALQNSLKDSIRFSLLNSEKGAFPSLKRPRVFWIGLREIEMGSLFQVQNAIENEMEKLGFDREKRKYNPHLTVGRVRDPLNLGLVIEKFTSFSLPEIEFSVKRILVMKSELTPKGAIYSVQKSLDLN
jgi:2'-5' RNA ligase